MKEWKKEYIHNVSFFYMPKYPTSYPTSFPSYGPATNSVVGKRIRIAESIYFEFTF